MRAWLVRAFKCFFLGHDWSTWRHDPKYIMAFDAHYRYCKRRGCDVVGRRWPND